MDELLAALRSLDDLPVAPLPSVESIIARSDAVLSDSRLAADTLREWCERSLGHFDLNARSGF